MIFVLIYILFSFLIGVLGIRKPLGFFGYFISSLILTPVVGLLLIAASGERPVRRSERESRHIAD
jgi:hypothetical protein